MNFRAQVLWKCKRSGHFYNGDAPLNERTRKKSYKSYKLWPLFLEAEDETSPLLDG